MSPDQPVSEQTQSEGKRLSGDPLQSANEASDNPSASSPTSGSLPNEVHMGGPEIQTAILVGNDMDDGNASSTSSLSDDEIDNASRLTKEELFQAYVQKLEREQATVGKRAEKKGPKLVESFVDYVHGLESRIEDLESKLRLKQKSKDDMQNYKKELPPPDDEFTVRFFHMAEEVLPNGRFKSQERMANTFRSVVAPSHFIRILYRWRRNPPISQPKNDDPPDPSDIEVVGIRIQSMVLVQMLFNSKQAGLMLDGIVELYRPFRFIIRDLAEIQKWLAHLEEVHAADGLNPKPTDDNASSEHDIQQQGNDYIRTEHFESRAALPHFRIFLEFVERYLEPQLNIYAEIQDGSCSKVSFENLWMLFEYNSTIYCPGKQENQELRIDEQSDQPVLTSEKIYWPQAFRVVRCTGGVGIGTAFGSQFHDDWLMKDMNYHQGQQGTAQNGAPMSIRERFSPLVVFCFYVEFDAKKYGPQQDFFIFRPFEGEVDITSLEAYPVHFHSQKDKTLQGLLDRGRKFIEMTAVSHMNYEGLTVGDDKEEIISSVIVDRKLAFQENVRSIPRLGPISRHMPTRLQFIFHEIAIPRRSCEHGDPCYRWSCMGDFISEWPNITKINPVLKRNLYEYEPKEKDPKLIRDEMKRHLEAMDFLILLPGDVTAYALRNRKWVNLDIRFLEPVVHDAGWKDLVLPRGHKAIVQAMVENHAAGTRISNDSSSQRSEVDLVRGKGKGCIILIHGAPGVGKTSTAECVAAYTNRPLFPITCGDIGYQPEQVEKNLERLFNLAHKWGCVLLLDEADVFLAKRNKEDVKRNGLVSVFLRILEYYSGILFLTTNRVGAIDDAFRSRLHLILYYPQLDRDKTHKIWKMNIRRLKNLNVERERLGRPHVLFDKKKILQYADLNFEELHWNGRQIRNAFQSALALADFEVRDTPDKSPNISRKHFHTIAEASQEFDRYLHVTHGADEDKIAQQDKTRGAYRQTEAKKLKLIQSSDDSDSSSNSSDGHEASESETRSDDSGSDARRSARKKEKKRKSKKHSSKKEQKREESQTRKKKGKGKEKEKAKAKAKNEASGSDTDSDTED
ncbi:hypothetical protein F5X99DRAFT_369089 [Biscogniauxia marginata]|nr:hypothetical protein F5X99DRAFT_369089 [Biscogniauxia marginata]